MGRSFLIHIITFVFAVQTAWAENERAICDITPESQQKIEACQRHMNSKSCEDVPGELKKNCFSEYSQEEFNYAKICIKDGTKKALYDAWRGVKDLTTRAYHAATDNKDYKKRVDEETRQNCNNDRKVIDARDRFNRIIKNIGADMAYMKFHGELERVEWDCYYREQSKGKALGLSFEIPDIGQLVSTLGCMSTQAQTEFGCSVLIPAVATGGTVGAAKALLKLRAAEKVAARIRLATKEFKKYLAKTESKLTPAEAASLKHQQDLLDALSNPEVAARMGLKDADLKNLIQGIIDSDAGKLNSFKKYLTDATPDSDQLINVIKGADNNSKAGKAFQEFMHEYNMGGKGLLNKELTNDQIREVFRNAPATQGFLHELPGLSEAIRDVNSGAITPAQFKKRLGANLFHNGPESGFWDFFTNTVLPGHMKDANVVGKFKDTKGLDNFFKNTAFQGQTAADGFVRPKYPSPVTKEGFIHTTFDRLSQATSGGNEKIFLELFNGPLSQNPHIPMGELKNFTGAKALDTYRNTLIGGPNVTSNGVKTVQQFQTLERALLKSDKIPDADKANITEIIRASRDRTFAFDDFVKKNATFDLEPDGSVKMISFKDSNGNYMGAIKKDTPASEAQALMKKFYDKEEAYNGHPIKDLMQPRLLAESEKLAYGKAAGLGYFYCSANQFKSGRAYLPTATPAPPPNPAPAPRFKFGVQQ